MTGTHGSAFHPFNPNSRHYSRRTALRGDEHHRLGSRVPHWTYIGKLEQIITLHPLQLKYTLYRGYSIRSSQAQDRNLPRMLSDD